MEDASKGAKHVQFACLSSLAQHRAIVVAGLKELYMARASQYSVIVTLCRPGQTMWKLKVKLEQRSSMPCMQANGSLKHRMPCLRTPFHKQVTLTRNTYTHWWGRILVTQHLSTYCDACSCYCRKHTSCWNLHLACWPACMQQLDRSPSNATATTSTLNSPFLMLCCIHECFQGT